MVHKMTAYVSENETGIGHYIKHALQLGLYKMHALENTSKMHRPT